ncbi:MAG TPA: histidinol-phosphate transaminase [Methylomirabilota bacterium]|nr:histidinol-phosphate transaminase [Methylomirabilota bacterium]
MPRHVATVRRAVLRMKFQTPSLEGRAGRLRLDLNENTLGCSPAVIRALRRLSVQQIATYPEYRRVTAAAAAAAGVRPQELHLTNGGDDALRIVYDVFVDRGSSVLFPEPTFPMYRFFAETYGARVIAPRYDAAMRFPLNRILAALQQHPRVLFLANPNNPTGNLLPPDDLRRILSVARHTAVVVDEAYVEFSGWTAARWIRRHANLVVARTFSKAAGLAGLRLGCLIARPALVEFFRRVSPPFNVNAAALAAVEAAVRYPAAIRRYVEEVRRARAEFEGEVERLGFRSFPSVANFLLVDLGKRGPAILRKLRGQGILIRDLSAAFRRKGMVRISIGTRRDMRRLARALAR